MDLVEDADSQLPDVYRSQPEELNSGGTISTCGKVGGHKHRQREFSGVPLLAIGFFWRMLLSAAVVVAYLATMFASNVSHANVMLQVERVITDTIAIHPMLIAIEVYEK